MVEQVQQQFSQVADPPNFIVIRRSNDDLVGYLHLRQSSALVNVNDTIQRGQRLGLVSNVGGGTPHLHLAAHNRPETLSGQPSSLLVTRPSYFVDYCTSDDFGQSWSVVRIGTPRLGQWVCRMKPDATCN